MAPVDTVLTFDLHGAQTTHNHCWFTFCTCWSPQPTAAGIWKRNKEIHAGRVL